MEGQSGLSELSIISLVSPVEGCLLHVSGIPLYNRVLHVVSLIPRLSHSINSNRLLLILQAMRELALDLCEENTD